MLLLERNSSFRSFYLGFTEKMDMVVYNGFGNFGNMGIKRKPILMVCILVLLVENYEMLYETLLINATNQIYSGDYQIRDLPTYDVYTILVRIENFFSFLAIIFYVGFYKSSSSSVFFKIRKFLGLALLWFTYTSLTLAFTLYEFVFVAISLLVAILLLIDYRRKGKEEAELVTSVDIPL